MLDRAMFRFSIVGWLLLWREIHHGAVSDFCNIRGQTIEGAAAGIDLIDTRI